MDWFSICLDGITLMGLSVMHVGFASHFVGNVPKARHFIEYFFLICLMQAAFVFFDAGMTFSLSAELLALYGMCRLMLRKPPLVSCVTAVLAAYVFQLSFGLINSLEAVFLPLTLGGPLLYIVLFLATMAALVLCACCYMLILRFLSLPEMSFKPHVWILPLSGLFFFFAEIYIIQTGYGRVPLKSEPERHLALLSLQVLGLGALICMLYAYRRVCLGLQAQAALNSLRQAAQAQKTYVAEAQIREEKTRTFRHDIKNHLSVLRGLLDAGNLEEAKTYLEKMESVSTSLSYSYQTGNPVVDILLGEKLGLARAKGIETEVSLILPKAGDPDDFDLCVIFANALDNAIQAGMSVEGEKHIKIKGESQGDFYRIEFENTCLPGPLPPVGVGLSHVRSVAEKYSGAMLTEKTGCVFRLHVLLSWKSDHGNRR